MRTALDVHRDLIAADLPHEVIRLPARIATADDLPEALDLETGCLATRMYRVTRSRPGSSSDGGGPETALVAVVVPAGAVPHPTSLLQSLDADSARPATAAEVNAATGYAADLVCPVGLPDDVEVLADAAIGATEVVYLPAGEGGIALGIRTRDLLVAARARAASLTPGPAPVPQPRFADIVDLDADRVVLRDARSDGDPVPLRRLRPDPDLPSRRERGSQG